MHYIPCLFTFLLLFILGQCNDKFLPLPLIYRKGYYEVVLPTSVQPSSSWMKRTLSQGDTISHFCRLRSRAENVTLEFERKNEKNLYLMHSSKEVEPLICEEETVTIVEKVSNALRLNNNFDNNVIDWFVVGFKIYKENLEVPSSCTKGGCIELDSEIEYENLEEGFHIVEVLSIFFNKKLNQPVAAKYTLYPAKEYYEYQNYWNDFKRFHQMNDMKLEAMEKCYEIGCPDPSDPESADSYLQVVALAPLRHFITSNRKLWVKYNTNATYIRQSNIPYLNAMDRFLEIVAQTVGKLTITAGTTITNENIGNEISVPDLIWKVAEFEDKKGKTYGIILIMFNSKNNSSICDDVCKKNKWEIKQNSNIIDQISCCDMENSTIVKLKSNFLKFKENNNSFNLNLWKMPKT